MAKKAVEIGKKRDKWVLIQTQIGQQLANLFDSLAEQKEISRAALIRELLEYCGKEIMCGNLK